MGNQIGIPALLGALGILGVGIFKKFFSTGAQRNKRDKLENELSKLLELPISDKRRNNIMRLQSLLAGINRKLTNQTD